MKKFKGNRRSFLRNMFSFAGASLLPGGAPLLHSTLSGPTRIIEFKTYFPRPMTLEEYRGEKTHFENKDKVTALLATFKQLGKIHDEKFSFHGSHSAWRVEFQSEAAFQEWMSLTDQVGSHLELPREDRGFRLEIQVIA